MISPKCTGSIPSCRTIGSSTGTRIVIAATGSRKQPTNSIRPLASSRNTHGSCVNPSTQPAISSVVLVTVSIQPKIDAAATMNSTVAVVSMVSIDTLISIFQCSVRNQAMPRNSAHTQAAIAPSVAVNTPLVIPPINSTGVMIGSTALKRKYRSAASSRTSPMTTVHTGSVPWRVAIQIPIGNPATIANSSRALPMRFHSNAMSPPHLFLCAKNATVDIISNASTTPGRMPARNSAPTDTLANIA